MSEYVKICPKCEHKNPESSNNCSECGVFFFDVPPVPPPVPPSFEIQDIIYLDLVGTTNTYEIQNGWILGRSDPESRANIQLSNIYGVNFIHRRHCLFDYCNGQWFITALVNKPFTNSSFVNQTKLEPGQRYPIKNGDKLTLSKLTLNIRIV